MKHNDLSSFKVIYEYIPSPDAAVRRQRICRRREERLNRAYDMLFDKVDPFDFAQGQYLSVTEVLRKML